MYIKLLLSLLLTCFLIFLLNKTWIVGADDNKSQTPRFGYFFSPNAGFWQQAEGKLPNLATTLRSDKLSAPVKVVYDDRMVPHIFAANTNDAYFAQGYVTASFRLWQMEFQTHVAAGRLAELIGNTKPVVIEMDKKARRMGLPRAAKKAVELWQTNKDMFATLQAYCDGVNAYIGQLSPATYPLEYKLLDYAPEPWTVEKSALLLKFMAKDLTGRDEDFHATNAYKLLGAAQFERLYPEYFVEQSPIVQDSFWKFTPVNAVTAPNAGINPAFKPSPWVKKDTVKPFLSENIIRESGFEQPAKGIGSNNWAVAPRKTANGKAILANDPHLRLNLPSIWFEIQIQTPEYNTYGASLPGSPAVISGFNEFVAWGVTNVSHDVQDWYKISWKDASKDEYMVDSAYRKSVKVLDTIKVRGAADVIDTLIYTDFGIVALSQNGEDFALRWVAHEPSMEPLTFMGLNAAKNYEDYKKAISYYACPAQNIVFAANNGDIAITPQGKLPVRKFRQGKFIQDGSVSANLYQDYIPNEQLPYEYNPAKGFVGSANQHSTNPTYPYYYHGYFEEFRGRYLNQKLASMSGITIADMQKLQNDNYSYRAKDFMPLLLKHLQRATLSKEDLELLALVEKWDYQYQKDAIAPVIFNAWLDKVQSLLYDEITELNVANKLETSSNSRILYPEEWHLLNLLKRDTLNVLFDRVSSPNRETYKDIVTLGLQEAYKSLGGYKNIPNWATVKSTDINHLARIEAFGFMNLQNDGDKTALNAMTATNGPSWRMVVELGGEAYGIYPGGQSGNVGSSFYGNMVEKWAKGEYYPLLFMKKDTDFADKVLATQMLEK